MTPKHISQQASHEIRKQQDLRAPGPQYVRTTSEGPPMMGLTSASGPSHRDRLRETGSQQGGSQRPAHSRGVHRDRLTAGGFTETGSQQTGSQQTSRMDPLANPAGQVLRPVFQERLQVKYLKAAGRQKPALDASRWRFLNLPVEAGGGEEEGTEGGPGGGVEPGGGLGSGRGVGPRGGVEPGGGLGSDGGVGPVLLSSRPRDRTGRRTPTEPACLSRQSGAQRRRRQRVAAVERKLLQHPLGLHEHYEQGMPPELFQKVLSVLDPDMCVREPQTPGSTPEEAISKLSLRFQDRDASLREAGRQKAVDDARIQDPKRSPENETSWDHNVCPEDLQFQRQSSSKEEKRQMFGFKAFRQYLIQNRLRAPEKRQWMLGCDGGSSRSPLDGTTLHFPWVLAAPTGSWGEGALLIFSLEVRDSLGPPPRGLLLGVRGSLTSQRWVLDPHSTVLRDRQRDSSDWLRSCAPTDQSALIGSDPVHHQDVTKEDASLAAAAVLPAAAAREECVQEVAARLTPLWVETLRTEVT
ncbi:unnamed protein product [Gadus morhua 'NCC']